jgi:hypothetical protein
VAVAPSTNPVTGYIQKEFVRKGNYQQENERIDVIPS